MNNKANSSAVIERINSEYYNLTAAEKKAADFIAANSIRAQHMSISEMAKEAAVAEATISRFSRRLGYKSFNDLKLSIAAEAAEGREQSPLSGDVSEGESFSQVCRKICATDIKAITDTMKLIDESKIKSAVDLIEKAAVVICMGQGGSMILAEEAAHLFTTVESKYFAISDSHTQAITASTMNEKGLIMYFSYSGATIDAIQTLRLARERGVKIILITKFPNAPATEYADVVLQCGSNESLLQLGSAPAKIAQIFLMDVLFSELCMRNLTACRDTRKQIADVLAEKHI